jgi:hypothetical protein
MEANDRPTRQSHLTSNPAYEPDDGVDVAVETGDVSAAMADVAAIMHAMETGRMPMNAGSVIRLQRATRNLEALVAQLP